MQSTPRHRSSSPYARSSPARFTQQQIRFPTAGGQENPYSTAEFAGGVQSEASTFVSRLFFRDRLTSNAARITLSMDSGTPDCSFFSWPCIGRTLLVRSGSRGIESAASTTTTKESALSTIGSIALPLSESPVWGGTDELNSVGSRSCRHGDRRHVVDRISDQNY